MNKKDKRCDGCGELVDIDSTMNCISSEFKDLEKLGVHHTPTHFDDAWFCKKCLNSEGFCQNCSSKISKEKQIEIGEYLDKA